jgi:hypothetical protein
MSCGGMARSKGLAMRGVEGVVGVEYAACNRDVHGARAVTFGGR